MEVSTFADWAIVLLGAIFCLVGTATLGYALYIRVQNTDPSREFMLTPLLVGGLLIYFGVQMLDAFDTSDKDDESNNSSQQSTR